MDTGDGLAWGGAAAVAWYCDFRPHRQPGTPMMVEQQPGTVFRLADADYRYGAGRLVLGLWPPHCYRDWEMVLTR
ncbi:hypothetical protein ABT369_47690 [Dactylosporangium sp. NPDC000244]|uniref:hypothetical protein n=1 Tax=Dactylosporangium sp. NPDC000244 TaxID=3154365 RepID=UPI00331F3096